MRLTEEGIQEILVRRQAVLTDVHVVYTSGKHGEAYVNKDVVLPHVADTSALCKELAYRVRHLVPEVVVAPVAGAIALSQSLAHHLSRLLHRKVLAVYADRRVMEHEAVQRERDELLRLTGLLTDAWSMGDAERIAAARALEVYAATVRVRPKQADEFVLKRGYDKLVFERRALIVEDIVNTGGSIRETAIATGMAGAEIVGACCLVNRGGQTAEMLGFRELISLLNVQMDAWDEHEMPDWLRDRPITTEVGKGKEYLAKKASSSL